MENELTFPMKTDRLLHFKLSILGMLVAFMCIYVLVCNGKLPVQLPFNTSLKLQDLAQNFATLLAWLFAVALFAERAVEVIVMVFRDQEADLLDQAENDATENLKTATDITGIAAARQKLADAQKSTVLYRARTKEIALIISFALGILVSFAGIHALGGVIAPSTGKDDGSITLFKILDILITGAMIAGGSEGIHRIANVFTSTMDSLATRANQAQKNSK
jgi:hypothetical protein